MAADGDVFLAIFECRALGDPAIGLEDQTDMTVVGAFRTEADAAKALARALAAEGWVTPPVGEADEEAWVTARVAAVATLPDVDAFIEASGDDGGGDGGVFGGGGGISFAVTIERMAIGEERPIVCLRCLHNAVERRLAGPAPVWSLGVGGA